MRHQTANPGYPPGDGLGPHISKRSDEARHYLSVRAQHQLSDPLNHYMADEAGAKTIGLSVITDPRGGPNDHRGGLETMPRPGARRAIIARRAKAVHPTAAAPTKAKASPPPFRG